MRFTIRRILSGIREAVSEPGPAPGQFGTLSAARIVLFIGVGVFVLEALTLLVQEIVLFTRSGKYPDMAVWIPVLTVTVSFVSVVYGSNKIASAFSGVLTTIKDNVGGKDNPQQGDGGGDTT